MNEAANTQVGGDHYKRLAIQPWAAMEAWMTPEQFKGYLLGCALKYLARNKVDAAEDHRKAAHYLQKLIEVEGGAPVAERISDLGVTARDISIAQAVRDACIASRFTIPGEDGIDLAAIIATVKD